MTIFVPVAIIVLDEHKTDAEEVLGIYHGSQVEFGLPLISADDPSPSHESTVVAWALSYGSSTDADVAVYQGLSAGALPAPKNAGVYWGVDGVISAEDAMLATGEGKMWAHSVSGGQEAAPFLLGVLAGHSFMHRPAAPSPIEI